jgi:hypothetical protein
MSKTEFDAVYFTQLVKLDTVMQMSALSTVRFHALLFPPHYTGSMFLINGLFGKNVCQFRSPVSSKRLSPSVEQWNADRMTYGWDCKEFLTAVSP